MIFEAKMDLYVSGGPDRGGHFQQVIDAFYELEQADDCILDSSFGFTDHDEHSHVEVEVTVKAKSEDAASDLVSGAVRTAIHMAGGFTPNWGERVKDGPAYRVTDETVERVPALAR